MQNVREGADGNRKAVQLLIEGKDEAGKGLTDPEIEGCILTLIAAGYDTAAVTSMSALYELHQNKEVIKLKRKICPGCEG